jgi:hypothetical protein
MAVKMLLGSFVVTLILGLGNGISRRMGSSVVVADSTPATRTQSDSLTTQIEQLATGSEAARMKLLKESRKSSRRRIQIIKALMAAMDQPNLNFSEQGHDYFLWREGSGLLGQLKAIESLDLLISHLDLNDGFFDASMTHQPAIVGVVAMGQPAVPKLDYALQHNANRDIRMAAVFCLGAIGGRDGKNAIRRALSSESDPCVRRLLSSSLDLYAKELRASNRSATAADFSAELTARKERLIAFSCR